MASPSLRNDRANVKPVKDVLETLKRHADWVDLQLEEYLGLARATRHSWGGLPQDYTQRTYVGRAYMETLRTATESKTREMHGRYKVASLLHEEEEAEFEALEARLVELRRRILTEVRDSLK